MLAEEQKMERPKDLHKGSPISLEQKIKSLTQSNVSYILKYKKFYMT